ncbi:MAG: DUF5388 domain-containing protein [Liquorilactobacillus ghanensis]|uniref:DUF5388 domain-containing protein n=1 Tax=Liquorilactobacillus ghanensis TaxID=399370 RepID=UPI0039EB2289
MGLLNHNQNSNNKKKLERGAKIIVNNQVNREKVVSDDETVTFPVNIRVDNHIRNQISALNNLGIGDSQKNLVQSLVEKAIDELPESDRIRYNKMFNILEQKDYLKKL